MAAVWQEIRTGAWLTPKRLRGYSVLLLAAYLVAAILWIGLAHGMVDRNNKPIGADFSNVYAAGTLTLVGKPDLAYDWPSEHAVEKATFGQDVPFFGWHYPPQFLMMAAVLALVPYGWAVALWMATTLSAYIVVIRAIVPHPMTALIALAYPAVFVNLGHGQNGFISAALLGGALLLIDRRPVASGLLIGLLAYKPQFGVLISLVLLATARWTVIAAAAVTVLATCVATLALFGTKVWIAFAVSTTLTRHIVLEAGGTGWEKIQSVFSAVRMWGGSVDLAYAAQGGTHTRRGRRPDMALAQRGSLRPQSCRARRRHVDRHALCPRLRSDDPRRGDRVLFPPQPRVRLPGFRVVTVGLCLDCTATDAPAR